MDATAGVHREARCRSDGVCALAVWR